ncbi:MFS transporter [Paraburkholderia sp. J76]|uniref:MFS transporter n=1 Tax=Paraburkholderia sp. J76 TaxID=2805439 RepID=UPI002ABDC775|nr:MFS transporter [Paraburkholderia sp. J76]
MFDDLIDNRAVSGRQKLIFALCLIVLIIDGMDVQLLAFASPVLLREWHIVKTQLAPALAAALVGMAVGATFGGLTADRLGCRRTLIGAVVSFGLTTLASALVTGVTQLIVLRFLSGIGFGIAVPVAMALVSEWSPRRLRGQLVLLMSIGTMLGGTLGGVLAAWLIPALGWRSLFYVSGGVTVVAAVLGVIYLPESLAFLKRQARESEARAWLERVIGGEIGPLRASAERSTPDASVAGAGARLLSPANLRVNVGLWTAFFTLSYAAYAYVSWTPTMLVGAGFNLRSAIASTSIYTFAAVLGVLTSGVMLPRMGSRSLLVIAIVVTGVATVAFPYLLAGGVTMPLQVKAAMFFAGLGGGMSQSTIYALAATAYPATYRATALGTCVGISRVGGIVSTSSGGVLLEASGANGVVYFGVLAVMLTIGLIGLVAMNRHTVRTGAVSRRVSA